VDPRAKLIVALAYVAAVAATSSGDAFGLAVLTGLQVLGAARLRISVRTLALRLLPLAGLGAAAVAGVAFGAPPSHAIGLTARLVLMSAAALILTLSMPFTSLVAALHALRVPATIVSVLLLTGRYMHVLDDEARRAARAWRSRSVSRMGVRQAAGLGRVAASLIRRAVERADRIAWAMVSRGFDGTLPCPPLQRMGARDVLLSAACVAGMAGLVWSRR